MPTLSQIDSRVHKVLRQPGASVVWVARWHLGVKALVFTVVLAAFWVAGWRLGAFQPIPWRMSSLLVDASAVFLWGTGIGLCCIGGNLLLTYLFLSSQAVPFHGGWGGPVLALVLAAIVGLMREHIIRLSEARDAAGQPDGMVAICSHCKRIRAPEGDWQEVDHYVEDHSALEFTHSICPVCLQHEMQRFDQTG